MKLKIKIILLSLLFIIFILFILFIPKIFSANSSFFSLINSFFPQTPTTEQIPLKIEDLAKIIQPSVVRLINRISGTITAQTDFKIDFYNKKIISTPLAEPIDYPVDSVFSGTGFMISPDGYIMTNSHVVSSEEYFNSFVENSVLSLIKEQYSELSAKDKKIVDDMGNSAEGQKEYEKLGADLAELMFNDYLLDAETTITVLNPTSSDTTIEGFISDGFLAKVISVNENYYEDQKDVAIIKISQSNLPAIPISSNISPSSLVIGQKIYAFGFPATADINSKLGKAYVQSTFTSGTIGALKSSDNGDFQIIQTDTKISSGSSGSPALDGKGDVIGIMTYVSAKSGSAGDSFSFALPNQIIRPIIAKAKITVKPGLLYEHFINGLNLFNQNHCTQAIKEFTLAKTTNPRFPADTNFIDSYISQCKVIQANGKSIDTDWQQFTQNLKPLQIPVLIAIFLIILGIVIISLVMFFSKKIEAEEEEILTLKYQNRAMLEGITPLVSGLDHNLETRNEEPKKELLP